MEFTHFFYNAVKDFPEDLIRSCINKTKYVMESFFGSSKIYLFDAGSKTFSIVILSVVIPYYFHSCQLGVWNHHPIQGRIQDLWLGGAWVGEGSGHRLRSPAGPRQSKGRGPGGQGAKPPGNSGGLRNYRHLFERQFRTNHTILIRPKKLDFES